MIPRELPLPIFRDSSFKLELVSQVKNYTYDPAVNTDPADLQRTHTQNLEHHGFIYEYIDFATVYTRGELVIMKPYSANGSNTPLMTLKTPEVGESVETTGLEFTDKSVKISINPVDAKAIDFDTAVYKLRLIIEETLTAEQVAAGVIPEDEVDILVFGEVTVSGEK